MKRTVTILTTMLFLFGCIQPSGEKEMQENPDWKSRFNQLLPLLGHRNWVLVVDKAFPLQNTPGITVINTGEKLIPVLTYVTSQISECSHIRPVLYNDAELAYLLPEKVPGLDAFKNSIGKVFAGQDPIPVLHDSVFVKIDHAAKLFSIVVLKTDETIPYSSVFIELGCKYWSQENEREMRERMK